MTVTNDVEEPKPARAHRFLVYAIIVLAAVVMSVSVASTWLKRQALDTDNWVDASDQLLVDDTIRDALASYLVDELYDAVDISAQLEERLPGALSGLADPLAAGLRKPATEALDRILMTDQVQELWERANRLAHEQLVRVLRDETPDSVSTADGVVTLDLGELVGNVATRLGVPQSVVDRIPPDAGQITLVKSDRLAAAQNAVTVIEWTSSLMFILVVALFVLAVVLARGWRWIALRAVGIVILIVGLLVLLNQRIFGEYVVDTYVKDTSNEGVVNAAWTIVTRLLRDIGWNSVAVGIVVIIVASLAGPGRLATRVRSWVAPFFTASPAVVWGVTAVVILGVLMWAPLPVLDTWWGALLAAVLLAAGVEALRRQCQLDELAAPDADGWADAAPDADPDDAPDPALVGARPDTPGQESGTAGGDDGGEPSAAESTE